MKLIVFNIIIFLLIFLFGCLSSLPSLPSKIPGTSEFYVLDFTPFSNQGFLFTPDKYHGDYESIGIIEYRFTPEQTLVTIEGEYNQITGFDDLDTKTYVSDEYDIQDGLEQIFLVGTDMGANAVISLKVDGLEVDGLHIDGYKIRGFAIKRISN